jgi:hypothetical protein
MPKLTSAQFKAKLLKDDPYLIEFSKNPKDVLKKKFNYVITQKQSLALKRFMTELDSLCDAFPNLEAVGLFDWAKRKAKAVVKILRGAADVIEGVTELVS